MSTAPKSRATKRRKKPGPPSRGGKTPLFAFRLAPDLVARIDARADLEGVTRSAVLRSAAEKYLAELPGTMADSRDSGKNPGIR